MHVYFCMVISVTPALHEECINLGYIFQGIINTLDGSRLNHVESYLYALHRSE